MALTKEKKIEIVEKLKKIVKSAKSLVFVNFHGLNVADVTVLRKKLRTLNIGYVVSKKTLLTRALSEIKAVGQAPELPGEIALAYLPARERTQAGGDDLLSPSREIYNFHKEHKNTIKIIGGVFDGKYMDALAMIRIATIPGREVLLAQFVNLINSPIQRLALALNEIASSRK